MAITYKVYYAKDYNSDGSPIWTELNTFERPQMLSDKLDETLDSGVLTIQNDKLVEITPYTQIRTIATDEDGNTETIDWIAGDIVAEMTRAT